MTPLNIAKREEWEAAVAVNEARLAGDVERFRLATEWHQECLARREGAEAQHRDWILRLAQRRLAEIHAEQQKSA